MKSYEEVTEDVFKRRDAYFKEKNWKKKIAAKAAVSVSILAAGVCLVASGIKIWQGGGMDNESMEIAQGALVGFPSAEGSHSQDDRFPVTDSSQTDTASATGNLPVSYSSLQLPQGQVSADIITQYENNLATTDILPFDESMLSECCAILEGKITDMYLKTYSYDTYDDKFDSGVIYHNQSSSVVYELTVDRVWYGDQSLSGTSVLIEDETYLKDSYFSLKAGCSYVIPVYDVGETKWIRQELAGGDLTRDSRYSTLYPYHPQIGVTVDGSYIVTSDWETLCSGMTQDIDMDTAPGIDKIYPDSFVEYHPENEAGENGLITTEWRTLLVSKYDAAYYYDKMKLVKNEDFFIQLNQLIDRLP